MVKTFLFLFGSMFFLANSVMAQKDTIPVKKSIKQPDPVVITGKPAEIMTAETKAVVLVPTQNLNADVKFVKAAPTQSLSSEAKVIQAMLSEPLSPVNVAVSEKYSPVIIFCTGDAPVQLTFDDEENVKRIITSLGKSYPQTELLQKIKQAISYVPEKYKTKKVTDERLRMILSDMQ